MTELELLVDFHKDAERQGPGSSYETKKALSFINVNKNLNKSQILSIEINDNSSFSDGTINFQRGGILNA